MSACQASGKPVIREMSLLGENLASSERTAADYAADEVRLLITNGFLAPGQRLIESELLERIDVGRSTLREAFQKLAAEGLIELQHQRGARVRRMTQSSLIELFQMRECLEGYAARLAALHAHDSQNQHWLNEARAVWETDAVLENELAHMENNVPLHDGIVAMAGNSRLSNTLALFELPAYRLQFLKLLDRRQRERSATEHIRIINAITSGDDDRAESWMRKHVRRAGELALRIPGLA